MNLIEDHPMLGTTVDYERNGITITGVVTGVRVGTPLLNIRTGVRTSDTVRLRIKPDDGSKAIWTDSVKEVGEVTA